MSSNRLAQSDENYWSESPKGFSFCEDKEAGEEDQVYFGDYNREAANKIQQDLRAEVSSLQSFTSDGSSDELNVESSQRLKDLPGYLLGDVGIESGIERQLSLGQDLPKKQDRFQPPQVDETIHQFLVGAMEVPLESYKSFSQKKILLAKAIDINDGNAILAVTLFLFKTLKPSLFRQLLIANKSAADHYIRYLEKKNEISHLVDLLNMLGRTRDALILRYKQILKKEGNLQNFIKEMTHFHTAECRFSSDEDIAGLVNQHLVLSGIHKEIKEKKDSSFAHVDHPSVLKTLRYVSEHFYENTSPPLTVENVKSKYALNVKQYAWVVLGALVQQQKWPQIESLLLTKSWLNLTGSKDKCLLPLEDVCFSLHGAPVDLTARFVRLIDDPMKKLTVAKKLHCHMVVIDVYASQKDKSAILTYRSNLPDNSKEAIYAENILKNSGTKWKN